MLKREEYMMVHEFVAAIAAIERADQMILLAGIDIVRADQAESVTEPLYGLLELRRAHHAVADALNAGGALGNAHRRARARVWCVAGINHLTRRLDFGEPLDAPNHFYLVAVRFLQPHALAATRLVNFLDRRSAGYLRDFVEVFLARGIVGETDE